MMGPDYPQGPQAEWHGPPGPAKPTALEINACAERLRRDCARMSYEHRRTARLWIAEAVNCAPTNPEHALDCALLAMRYNPRAFALAGLIGQHCD